MIEKENSQDQEESEIENPDCPCTETYCPRHGKCSKCQEYHHGLGQKTCCGK